MFRRAIIILVALMWQGEIQISTASLLEEYTVRRWTIEDGLPENLVTSVAQAADGFLWCTTPRHRVRFDGVRFVVAPREEVREGVAPVVVSVQDSPPGCDPLHVTLLARGREDSVWVLAKGSLFSRQKGTWQSLPLPEAVRDGADRLTVLTADETGAVWAGAVHGVYRLKHGRWDNLTDRDGVFPWDVRCLMPDREENVWIGTSGGLVRLRHKRLQPIRTGQPTGDETITALLVETPTNIWVGLAGSGLLAGPPTELQLVRMANLPQHCTVSALLRSRDGALWIGTQGDGLWRWRDGAAVQIRQASMSQPVSEGISALLEDCRGVLWVGTWGGLMQVNQAGQLIRVTAKVLGPPLRALPAEMVQVLYEDAARVVWVGYQSMGLVSFAPDGTTQWFNRQRGHPSNYIRALLQDKEGVFWIGTTDGLVRWQRDARFIFTMANGLEDKSILQILEDDNGYLWLGTRRGIMRVKKTEFAEVAAGRKQILAVRVFGMDAGMFDPECTGRMGARASRSMDGRLWFPTMEGFVIANPQIIPRQPAPIAPRIEEVHSAQRVLYTAPFMKGAAQQETPFSIQLPTGVREVDFHFTAPLLTAPERAHFKWQLAGFDSDWSQATIERIAHYSRLTPGQYDFEVIARDRDSDWSLPTRIRIVVPPYFWETLWCWLLVVTSLVAGAVWAIHAFDKHQTARQLRALEQRHAVEHERGRIARDIHDDVGAGLTEMAMLSELAQEEGRQPGEQRQHLDNIFRRARQLTQSLDEIVWAINPVNDTLESLVSYVGEFAQDFLGVAGLICRLDLPANPPECVLGANVRHQLCLSVKEVLNNIVKHAKASEVHVAVKLTGQKLTISIQDNGCGFASPATGNVASGHDGLTNLRIRLNEINGQLLQESQPGQGTRVVLSVELPTTPAPIRKA